MLIPAGAFAAVTHAKSDANRGRAQVPGSRERQCGSRSGTRRRFETQRSPLVRPGHRKIDQSLQTEAARQLSVDRSVNHVGRKEGQRKKPADIAFVETGYFRQRALIFVNSPRRIRSTQS